MGVTSNDRWGPRLHYKQLVRFPGKRKREPEGIYSRLWRQKYHFDSNLGKRYSDAECDLIIKTTHNFKGLAKALGRPADAIMQKRFKILHGGGS